MEIEGILKSCLWILLHQGMFSLLCSKIQGYMLSLMNEVDPCVTSAVGFIWDAKPVFPTDDDDDTYYSITTTNYQSKAYQLWSYALQVQPSSAMSRRGEKVLDLKIQTKMSH